MTRMVPNTPPSAAELSNGSAPVLDSSLGTASASEGAAQQLDRLLALCVSEDASDLHLAPDLAPYFRIHGQLEPWPGAPVVSAQRVEELAALLAQRASYAPLGASGSLDGAISASDGTRFRFNVYRRQGQLSIALRRLEERFRSLTELGLPDELYELCDLPDGLVLLAGPTGAGKSTTLAALLDRINQTRRCHLITIEDPIEYLHHSAMSLVNQRQVGTDSESFHDALVASLRQDPDVILVGEIRDLNTIRTAITAAETGHLVFTTVHAGDCVGTIERLVSVFPADEQFGIRRQLSLVLRAVIAQHLLICDGPAANRPLARGWSAGGNADTDAISDETLETQTVRRRRVVASEVMMVNTAVANLICNGKSAQIYSSMETGGQLGMRTFDEDLARLWAAGQISETTAVTMARNSAVLRDRYQTLRAGGGGTVPPRGMLR